MKIFPFPAIYPNVDLISSPELFFPAENFNYADYHKIGFFQRTQHDSIYIYCIESAHQKHVGLIACADINAYLKGDIVKHEKTHPAKEPPIMNLLLQRQAMVKPVLLGYAPREQLDRAIQTAILDLEPFFTVHFKKEKEKHYLYRLPQGEQLTQLMKLFDEQVQRAYIADGHHRCSTSAKLYQTQIGIREGVNKYQYLLCALFPFDQLEIYNYNRVVEALGDISPTRFMAEISKVFEIKFLHKPTKPAHKHELTMYIHHEWYRLRWRPEVLKKYGHLDMLFDTSLINEEVMVKIFGIRDTGNDPRIHYVEGVLGLKGLIDKTNRKENRLGFCLYPVHSEEWVSISDEGKTLPPKSTWFEPRTRNGLIVMPLEN